MKLVCRQLELSQSLGVELNGRKLVSYLSSGLLFDPERPLRLPAGLSQHFFILASSSDLCLLSLSRSLCLTAFLFDTFILNRYFSMKLSTRPALFYSLILLFSTGHRPFPTNPFVLCSHSCCCGTKWQGSSFFSVSLGLFSLFLF